MAYVTKPYEESKLLPALAVAMGRFAEINDLLDSVEHARNASEWPSTASRVPCVVVGEVSMMSNQVRVISRRSRLDSVERNETELQATQEKLKDAEEKLKKTQDTLEERKLVDRAKGLLMDKANRAFPCIDRAIRCGMCRPSHRRRCRCGRGARLR